MKKQRIDQVLVDRGLAESRQRAQALILAGYVIVDGRKIEKAGQQIDPEGAIHVTERLRYVGRGGLKLEAALDHWGIDVSGLICLDVGASTGGFTDCLLQRGAAQVYAVDVGTAQLDWKLRSDERVVVHENLNARYLAPGDLAGPVNFAVCDVSFISVTLILPALPPLFRDRAKATLVILVKPQFEVGRDEVGKGGIVRDPELHRAACERISSAATALGFKTEIMESPILGAEGNREFLLYAHD